ncbi:MAG: hypothetical protein J7647_15610 [Cyanobacteria bacterium SBLK]|nr:hypothetical protein [Cyanobacteria bacterium SBLK]
MVTKRDNPNYENVSGYIPKQIASQFKNHCKNQSLSISDGLEFAVNSWLNTEHVLKQLTYGIRPDDVTIVELAHDLGISTADLLRIINRALGFYDNEHDQN